MADEWRSTLRQARRAFGINLQELASRAGVSSETVRAYEGGRRKPSREHLLAVVRALQMPAAEANVVLAECGFAPDKTLFAPERYPSYFFRTDETQAEVERWPWPAFASNDLSEVVAANVAVQALWDIDWQAESRDRVGASRNLLSVASDHHFADRLVNWDECVAVMASAFKARPHLPESIDQPSEYLNAVLAEFAQGDPVFLKRLIESWVSAPVAVPKVRWGYRVVWRDVEFGEMRFQGLVSTGSEPDGLSFNDWHPLDAETWLALEKVKARARPAARRGTRPKVAGGKRQGGSYA